MARRVYEIRVKRVFNIFYAAPPWTAKVARLTAAYRSVAVTQDDDHGGCGHTSPLFMPSETSLEDVVDMRVRALWSHVGRSIRYCA